MLPRKVLHRLARHLHDAWLARRAQASPSKVDGLRHVHDCIEEFQQAKQRFDKASRAGLVLVLPKLRTEVGARARYLQDGLICIREHFYGTTVICPGFAFLVAELRQLEEEF